MGMSLASLLYPVIKPLLFRLDAEAAHELTTRMMRVTHSLGLLGREAIADGPPVSVMGLNFPNRLGLAAGMDKKCLIGQSEYASFCRTNHFPFVATRNSRRK